MKKIRYFFVFAIFTVIFVFALSFGGTRDGPERVAAAFDDPVPFVETSASCVQCHGGLDADRIVMGVSPLIDTETAFTYVLTYNGTGVRLDPG